MKHLIARLRHRLHTRPQHQCAASGQCSVCSGWFDDWPGGICAACLATGRG